MATTPKKLPAAPSKTATPTKTLAQAKSEAAATKAAQDKAIAAQVAAANAAKAQQQAVLTAAKKALDQIPTATTKAQLDKLVQTVNAAGLTIPAATLKQGQSSIDAAVKKAADESAAQIAKDRADAAAKEKATQKASQEAARVKAEADAKIAAEKAAAAEAAAKQAEEAAARRAEQNAALEAYRKQETEYIARATAENAQRAKENAARQAEESAAMEAYRKQESEYAAAQAAAAEQRKVQAALDDKFGPKYTAELGKATTQAELDAVVARAAKDGYTINPGIVNRAQEIITSNFTRAEQAAAEKTRAAAQADWVRQAEAAQTPEAVQSIIAQAQKAGQWNLNDAVGGGLVRAAQSRVDAIAQKETDAAQTEWYKLAQKAKTPEEIQNIVGRAQAAGQWNLNQGVTDGLVRNAQSVLNREQAEKTAEAQANWIEQVRVATTPDKARAIIEQARAAGQWNINDAVSQSFVDNIQRGIDQSNAAITAAAQDDWVRQVNAAVTPDQARSIIAQARSLGQWNINDAVTEGLVQKAQSIVDQANEQQRSTAQQGWVDQISAAATPDQARSIIEQAKAAGQWNINDAVTEGLVRNAQTRVDTAQQQQQQRQNQIDYDQRIANQTAASQAENAKFAAGLAKPSEFVNKFTPNGTEIQGRPDNPATPEDESGWYVPTADGLQRVGADGKLTGPVIPDYDEFNRVANTQRQETRAFEQKQQEDQRVLAASTLATTVKDFESKLPTPDEFRKTGASMLRGPDGAEYFLTAANLKTGEPSSWVRMDQNMQGVTRVGTDQTVSVKDFNQQVKTTETQNNEVNMEQRRAAIAAQRKANEGMDFGDFFKTLAVMAIAAVALPYISQGISAVSNAFTGAGGAAGAGAAGEAAAITASNMASAGASAAEISAALQAQGLSSAAATAAANTATGIVSGTVSSSGLLAASGVSADMIALANATLDPIAALNAAAGWTAVDVGYLASIGAPASLIAQAQATNIGLGLDPYGLTELSAAETAALEANIDPDLINRFQPSDAAAREAGRAGGVGDTGYFRADGTYVIPDTSAAVADVTTGMVGPAGSDAAFEAALANAGGGAVAPTAVPSAVASSAINPATGLLETITPGFGSSPVASVVLSTPAAAAATGAATTAAASALSPSALAALGGAAVLGGLAGGGGVAGGAAAGGATAGTAAGTTAGTATTPVVQPTPGGGTVTTYPDGSTLTRDAAGAVVDGGGTAAGTTTTTPGGTATTTPGGTATTTPATTPGGTAAGTTTTGPVAPTTTTTPATTPGGTAAGTSTTGSITPGPSGPATPGMIETVVPGTGSSPVASVTLTPAPVVPPAAVTPGLTPGQVAAGAGVAAGVAGSTGAAGGVAGGTPGATTPVVQPTPGGGTVTTYPDGSTLTKDATGAVVDGGGTAAGTSTGTGTAGTPGTPGSGVTVTNNPVTGMTETVTPGTGTSPVANVTLTPTPGTVAGGGAGAGTSGAGTAAGVIAGGAGLGGALAGSGGAVPPATTTPVAPAATTPPATTTPPVEGAPVTDAVATPNPNYTNPPAPSVPAAVADLAGAAAGSLSAADLAKIAAGWVIINGILTPPPAAPTSYGPIKPLDWGKSVPLGTSGLNPGYIVNVPQQYQTQNMQQSKFYWGQKPFQVGPTFSPETYRNVPAPAVPWGLQQMYNPQTQNIQSLLEGVQQASQVAPYNVPAAPKV